MWKHLTLRTNFELILFFWVSICPPFKVEPCKLIWTWNIYLYENWDLTFLLLHGIMTNFPVWCYSIEKSHLMGRKLFLSLQLQQLQWLLESESHLVLPLIFIETLSISLEVWSKNKKRDMAGKSQKAKISHVPYFKNRYLSNNPRYPYDTHLISLTWDVCNIYQLITLSSYIFIHHFPFWTNQDWKGLKMFLFVPKDHCDKSKKTHT